MSEIIKSGEQVEASYTVPMPQKPVDGDMITTSDGTTYIWNAATQAWSPVTRRRPT